MQKLGSIIAFVLGAGMGSAATYFIVKDRCEKIAFAKAEEEIQQVKEAFRPKSEKQNIDIPSEEKDVKAEMLSVLHKTRTDYSKIVKENGYSEEKKEDEEEMSMIDGEIIIEPDNRDDVIGFGLDPYDVEFATLYADGYLVTSNDHIIDIEMIGGKEALEHFGEGDDPELLHVRNVLYEIDYEIDRDDRTYAEVSGKDPSDLPDID